MRPVLEGLRTAPGTLPIGYECLAAAFAAPEIASRVAGGVAAGEEIIDQRTVWSACAQQARHAIASGSPANGLMKLLGWILTAAAGTLGAGYWFALLTKAINIRGAGPRPEAKAPDDKQG
jgi:hypothetical protein